MSKRKMLILGARGFLGRYVARSAADRYEVFRADTRALEDGDLPVDVADDSSVRAVFEKVAPDVVVLLAALSDIDRCQAEPSLAYATNVRGAEHVACASAKSNARLLFLSSAAVFNGAKHGYREDDPPTPVSVYGETKARAEDVVEAITPSAIIVRLALALGFAGRSGTNALLDSLAERWKSNRPVAFPTFEYRNPIDAPTLSAFLLELLDRHDAGGIYHLGSTESLSRFELGLRLAARMGFARDLVVPQTEQIPGRAPRGLDHFLLTHRIRATCRTPVPSCDEAIERCFDDTA